MLQIMEVCLAVGNYLNSGGKNAKAPATGFRLQSLLKMNEVTAKTSKTNLMHFIALEISQKRGDLLSFPEDLDGLQDAVAAIGILQVDEKALQKSVAELKTEVQEQKTLKASEQLIKLLSTKYSALDSELNSIKQSIQQMEKEVLWWGEADANDISGFLVTWLKFSQLFQKTVTFFKEQEKREKAKQEKVERQKQKEGEKKTIEKFVNNLQTNRKTGRGQGVENLVVEELLQGVLASMDTASAVS